MPLNDPQAPKKYLACLIAGILIIGAGALFGYLWYLLFPA